MCWKRRRLHDIGKIGVPDSILLKPGPLTQDEWQVMTMHDHIGVEIIKSSFACSELAEIMTNHHAWYAGNPRSPELPTGDDIPLGARILAIADAFDAIVSDRVYRRGRSIEDAFAELRRCVGTQFDPELVEEFIACVLARDHSRRVAARRLQANGFAPLAFKWKVWPVLSTGRITRNWQLRRSGWDARLPGMAFQTSGK